MNDKSEECVLFPADLLRRVQSVLGAFAAQANIIDRNDSIEGRHAETFEMFKFRGSYAALCYGDCVRAREVLRGIEVAVSQPRMVVLD